MSIKSRLKRIGFLRNTYHFFQRNSIKRILFRKNIKRIDKFDIEHGTDFGGRMYQDEIGVTKERANDYSPSPKKELYKIMKRSRLSEKDSIADLGCGKGYAMYLMAESPVGKIGGVELSEKLCDIARKNLEKTLGKTQVKWQVDCSDAGTWEGYDDYNIFYIYNSFPKVVMEEVKRRINESIERQPRKVTVWYLCPEYPEVFYSDSKWNLISRESSFKLRHGMHIFVRKK